MGNQRPGHVLTPPCHLPACPTGSRSGKQGQAQLPPCRLQGGSRAAVAQNSALAHPPSPASLSQRRTRGVTNSMRTCEEKGRAWETMVPSLTKAVSFIVYSHLMASICLNRRCYEMNSLTYFIWVTCTYPLNKQIMKNNEIGQYLRYVNKYIQFRTKCIGWLIFTSVKFILM